MIYLLSVVVPTKDRYCYLKQLVQLVKGFNSNEIELVIQDNTEDNTEIVSYLHNLNYEHLKYFHVKEQLSVSDNCSKAVLNSTGEYVCVLGDDDGVLSTIVDVVKYMKEKSIDALVPKYTIYNWPDYVDNSIYKTTATIMFNRGSGSFLEINPQNEFSVACQSGFRNMAMMPRVYQAIVRRESLDSVLNICGSFFPGPSPDMSNAVALSNLWMPPRTVCYDAPVIISGQGKSVGGGERLTKKDKLKKIDEVPFLPKNVKEIWDKSLPIYWCSDTVWPASAICAYKQITGNCLEYDIDLVIARFLYNHPAFYNECIGLAENKIRVLIFCLRFTIGRSLFQFRKVFSYFISGKRKLTNLYLIRNVRNISEAVLKLNENLSNHVYGKN